MEPQVAALVFAVIFSVGLVFQHYDRRRAAAAVQGLAFAFVLGFMPWKTVVAVCRFLPGTRHVPLAKIRLVWGEVSAAFGLIVALGLILRKPMGGRQRQWDAPRGAGNTDKDLGKILGGKPAKEGTLIGVSNGRRRVYLAAPERERHMQVVGPTRSGKSQLLFALSGQDMRQGMPVFFMEAKGDRSDFDQFLKLAGMAGRERDVRYFNPQDPRSMTFNPIRRLPGQDVTEITNQLARAIGREPTSKGEAQDYYRSLDYARMTNMVEVFCATGREFTLRDCHAYFSSDKARRKALDLCDDRRAVAAAHADFKGTPDTSGLTSSIRPWTTGNLGRLLNDYSPQIKLEEVFEQDQLAYFAVPIGRLQVLANPLGRMAISGLLSVASARQAASVKPGPASVILDEFAEFATPVFSSFIATVASARFWTVLSHQDLGQLKRIEGLNVEAFHSAVFANTSGCKVCFKTPAPEDAEFWSAALGTYKTFKDTERYKRSFLGTMGTGEVSRREVEEFKVHPNLLKSLSPGTA
ncbi:MAG: TraM recognition domain-containing protein, partial [Elusimicrobia bacterium]|nr:TraM recognition domain-containing protein [Elusimicrobiota bacterium]